MHDDALIDFVDLLNAEEHLDIDHAERLLHPLFPDDVDRVLRVPWAAPEGTVEKLAVRRRA